MLCSELDVVAGAGHGQQGGDQCNGGQLQPHGRPDQAGPRTSPTPGLLLLSRPYPLFAV